MSMTEEDGLSHYVDMQEILQGRLLSVYEKWGERLAKHYGIDGNIFESLSVQLVHPTSKQSFYLICGSGYDVRGDAHRKVSRAQQLGIWYRVLEKSAKFYDQALFSRELYPNAESENDLPFVFQLRLPTNGQISLHVRNRKSLPSDSESEFEWATGIDMTYAKYDPSFWTKLETYSDSTWKQWFIEYCAQCIGVQSEALQQRISGLISEKGIQNFAEAVYVGMKILLSAQKRQVQCLEKRINLFLGSVFFRWSNAYYDRIILSRGTLQGGIVISTRVPLRKWDYLAVAWRMKSVASDWLWMVSERQRSLYAMRSAIGSIMSRNGSHNIGSHVLAALSHNVGTMPDDRVLYQYIQHRMDYIATVTTDFPTWAQPTMFIGEMMKTFLSQRHLLEHIVGSEGLHAWQYQNPSWRDRDPEGCIQFHIRKLKEGKWVDFIDYAEYCRGGAEAPYKKSEKDTQTQYLTLSDDVALAIPGGVVGQHAFFTILENIIRNVAKHDWCTAKRDLKNLEIFIDFEDQEEDVRFCIWSKCSSANDNLVRSLEEKINASFIDKTGALRRENWGLAEMKISAGYLQRKDIGEIGGLDNSSSKGAEIIRPILVSENGKDNSLSYLGYEFRVAKPKTIAFVVSEAKELQHLFAEFQKNQDRVKKFRELGISILSENDLVAKAHKLDYEFVVLESLGEDQLGWDVPFRVLTATKTKLSAAGKIIACLGMDKYKSLLQGLFESGESVEDVANACKECKKEVLGSWCRHLIEDKRGLKKIDIDLV